MPPPSENLNPANFAPGFRKKNCDTGVATIDRQIQEYYPLQLEQHRLYIPPFYRRLSLSIIGYLYC